MEFSILDLMNLSQHQRTITANSTVLNTQHVEDGILFLCSVAWVKHSKQMAGSTLLRHTLPHSRHANRMLNGAYTERQQ